MTITSIRRGGQLVGEEAGCLLRYPSDRLPPSPAVVDLERKEQSSPPGVAIGGEWRPAGGRLPSLALGEPSSSSLCGVPSPVLLNHHPHSQTLS